VNQTVLQIKLGEMWKSAKLGYYPVRMEKIERNINERSTRQSKDTKFKVKVRTKVGKEHICG
jgi:hypothetical protein